MVLGSIQPSYLAWIPFMERMAMSDVFVYLDDVEFSKNSFHNRNRILTKQGPLTLTVPVLYKGSSKTKISEIEVDYKQKWQKKHWSAIQQNYSKAPFYKELAADVEELIQTQWPSLGDLNINLIEYFRKYVGISTPCHRSSETVVEGEANEKLVNLCKHFEADQFVVKPGTDDYHPQAFFEPLGVGFAFFTPKGKPYPQIHSEEFVPNLSILDYAMNCGPNSFYEI